MLSFFGYVKSYRLERKISAMAMPAETEAFSELTCPTIGIFTTKSLFFKTSLEIPKPSDPTTKQIGQR